MFELINEYSSKVTQKEIEDFENKYNIKIPFNYNNFLKKYNGGEINPAAFKVPKDNVVESEIRFLYSIGDNVPDYNNIEYNLDVIFKDLIDEGFLPIGYDGFGCQLLIGLSKEKIGKIYYYDLEAKGRGEDHDLIVEIGHDLDSFLSNLYD
jgi:hypothetical protein